MKDLYTIRITKSDEALKNYLEQFPVAEQSKALKKLLRYGVERIQENYVCDRAINELKEDLQHYHSLQEEKLKEIYKILADLHITNPSDSLNEKIEEKLIDQEKAKKSMQEALSMFLE